MSNGQEEKKPLQRSRPTEIETATGKIKELLSNTSRYVSEHGPKFAERTWLGGLLAYRRGAKALATNAISASGVDMKSAGISLALTLALFLSFNILCSFWISSVYHRYVPAFAKGSDSLAALEQAFARNRWKRSPETSSDLNKIITLENLNLPLYRWIAIGFLEISSDKQNTAPSDEMFERVTGEPFGWLIVQRKLTTGGAVYDKLLQSPRANRTLESGVNKTPERKELCIKMLDELVSAVRRPIRLQTGLNGSIQFATIFVGLFALTAVVRRYLFIAKLASNWLGTNFDRSLIQEDKEKEDHEMRLLVQRLGASKDVDTESLIRSEIDRLSQDTTKSIYETYWFIAGIMPSLGFIGTVVGMSSALMLANGLFVADSEQEKQVAIGEMTTQLGLAFDTTFVALTFGLIAGLPIAYVHSRERTFFREFSDCVTRWSVAIRAEEPRGGITQ